MQEFQPEGDALFSETACLTICTLTEHPPMNLPAPDAAPFTLRP
jgi:hypothetical protein